MPLYPRPEFQLRSLSVKMRWEVNRRHPYYSSCWGYARAAHRNEMTSDKLELMLRAAAIQQLMLIGVNGEPPDPATYFENLGGTELNQAWLSGTVHPLTFRSLATLLLMNLPAETLGQVGLIFCKASCEDKPDQKPLKHQAYFELTSLDMPDLNNYPREPFVSINPTASQRQIENSLELLLKQWKEERNLAEQRDRSDKHEEYLEVWDLREGWKDGSYQKDFGKTFLEIAEIKKQSVAKLSSQYYKAFELITGYPFKPELWWEMLGPIKAHGFTLQALKHVRRPMKSRSRQPVSDSVVTPIQGDSLIKSISEPDDPELAYKEFISDFSSLVKKGWTDERISEEMDLSLEAVRQVRARPSLLGLPE